MRQQQNCTRQLEHAAFGPALTSHHPSVNPSPHLEPRPAHVDGAAQAILHMHRQRGCSSRSGEGDRAISVVRPAHLSIAAGCALVSQAAQALPLGWCPGKWQNVGGCECSVPATTLIRPHPPPSRQLLRPTPACRQQHAPAAVAMPKAQVTLRITGRAAPGLAAAAAVPSSWSVRGQAEQFCQAQAAGQKLVCLTSEWLLLLTRMQQQGEGEGARDGCRCLPSAATAAAPCSCTCES